ncbi:MAG: diguanylate cyclase [Desulfuromonadales bacterium]
MLDQTGLSDLVLDSLEEQIAVIDSIGTIVYVNLAWKRFGSENGLPDECEWKGVNYLDICDTSKSVTDCFVGESVAQGMRDVISGKRDSYNYDYPCHCPLEKRWFMMHVTALKGDPLNRFLVAHHNITQHKLTEDMLRESEEKHRIFFVNSPDAYLIIRDGIFVDCNRATEVMLRGDRTQIIGHPPELLSPEFQPDGRKSSESAEEKIKDALQTGKNIFEWVHRRLDGSDFFVEVSIASMILDGKPALFTTWRDITERIQAQEALLESGYRWKFAIEGSGDGVWDSNIQTGVTMYSKRWKEMLGYADNDILPARQEWLDRIHPEDQSHVEESMQAYLDGRTEIYVVEYRLRCKDGSYKWILSRGMVVNRSKDGSPLRMIGTHTDITERKRVERALEEANSKLEILSITDGLTGIANRRRFDQVLAQEHARHVRSGEELSLVMLDIDHFKAFNDNYGHVSGDDCLRRIARAIAGCTTRPADLSARYGGEEFACILPETDLNGAIAIAEKIRSAIIALAIPNKGSTTAACVTASLGVATVQCTAERTPDEIVAQVDKLLYVAKSGGRNRIEFNAAGKGALTSLDKFESNFVQLVWKDTFRCGNNLIDNQHKSLFRISNSLLKAALLAYPAGEVSVIITQLLDEVRQHFHDEETILESCGFPGISQHASEHARLLSEGLELSREFEASTLSVGAVFQFLAYEVVMSHILGADREFFAYIR